ncbi:MAG: quinolinate synthase [Omnitrophica bacterium RIFCSPLOWO2_12_FULL_44_17]|uniref:Quinolinate synthase n=1 Tax=Candidatus Danuiimicrobium aquiferis TaxID=1801832 RepID=A0A1G1KTM1_9BACT|nr:MAG: quinolinate synthase [Omnitrophica bacterium RIFCSPHIGHO2_02_FULL_45_28]OGW96112.1 MAG: quinolinate synthase [Omnitrophica bacterium RIFCSPLOWO2_12_FULL_44_17]OGX04661.1 MAG: quinolinate synthase [Omnitrophica bacterium RIFCSPLOWO2_02_FULL_44_11]
MAKKIYRSIQEEIQALKKERDAVILAHNYQVGGIQDVADFVGDSLALSQQAKKVKAKVILFSGVLFMAETASILCPDKTVLIPSLEAGCSLSSMVHPEEVRVWRKSHPDGLVVAYVNSTADVKAESDYCCTSANAVKLVEKLPKDKDILFIPDYYLGTYVKIRTGRENMTIWNGYCHIHVMIQPEELEALKKKYPKAEILMHPECGCLTKSMKYADQILSTAGMIKYVDQSTASEFIIATETGLLHKLRKDHPDKIFIPATDTAFCNYMKQNTLESLVWSLENMKYEIRVSAEIQKRAITPIERMLEVCGG